MTVTAETQAAESPEQPAPRRRRRWIVVAVLVVVLAAAATTTTVWVRHYSAAPGLEVDSTFYGWVGADSGKAHSVDVGEFSTIVLEVRPHHEQTFEFWVHNTSSVTQTILGLSNPGTDTAEPSHILASAVDPDRWGEEQPAFRAAPVAVPPHQYRAIRYVLRSLMCWSPGRSETFTDVSLRVRVGAFTRTEDVSLGDDFGFVLQSTHATC